MTDYLTVAVSHADGRGTVLAVNGEIDRDSTHLIAAAAEEALSSGTTRLVLDLSGVTFCDSSGLKTFVQLHRLAAGQDASLRLAFSSGRRRPGRVHRLTPGTRKKSNVFFARTGGGARQDSWRVQMASRRCKAEHLMLTEMN